MFRAVRYEQRLGFQIDDETLSFLSSAVSLGLMNSVSGDRWLHEVVRILEEPDPGRVLLRAADLGLMSGLHPSLAKDDGIRALADGAEVPQDPDEWLAALFSPLTDAEGQELIQRLRLSGPRAALARDTIDLRNIEGAAGRIGERPYGSILSADRCASSHVGRLAILTSNLGGSSLARFGYLVKRIQCSRSY